MTTRKPPASSPKSSKRWPPSTSAAALASPCLLPSMPGWGWTSPGHLGPTRRSFCQDISAA
ncbi:unnamed protein product, partial [Symbiodinium necroappetens]